MQLGYTVSGIAFSLLAVQIAITGLVASAVAQSGRRPNEPIQVRPVQETSGKSERSGATEIFHETGRNFHLVFARRYAGKLQYTKAERDKLDPISMRHLRLDSFIRELNVAGRLGYRLERIVNGFDPVALLRSDEGRYEYAWFETVSDGKFDKRGLEEKLLSFTKDGFRISAHVPTDGLCTPVDENAYMACRYTDLFVVERDLAGKRRSDQRLLSYIRKPGSHPSVDISKEIGQLFAERYQPVAILSQLEVLLEKSPVGDLDTEIQYPEVRIVRGDSRNQLKKRVDEFGSLGFRLVMAANGVALMMKPSGPTRSYAYKWVDATERAMMGLNIRPRDVRPEIADLESKGAVFRMTYPDFLGNRSVLIFEMTNAKRYSRAYRIFDLTFDVTEGESQLELHRDLSEASLASLDMVNRLLDEGFEVRDLFVSNTTKVILEKNRNE